MIRASCPTQPMTRQRLHTSMVLRRACLSAALTLALLLAAPSDVLAAAGGEHESILQTIARLFNFAILAGVLVYFLRGPIADYLRSRSEQIRQDLVTAAEMRQAATARLEEIQRKLASLPAELEALKTRGAEDIAAEQARIAQTAETERGRLLDQTRREIAMRLRIARRELTEHAAQLAVQAAERRISGAITNDDQLRLLERYAARLAERGPWGSTGPGRVAPSADKEAR